MPKLLIMQFCVSWTLVLLSILRLQKYLDIAVQKVYTNIKVRSLFAMHNEFFKRQVNYVAPCTASLAENLIIARSLFRHIQLVKARMTGLTTHVLPGGVPLSFDDEDDEESSG